MKSASVALKAPAFQADIALVQTYYQALREWDMSLVKKQAVVRDIFLPEHVDTACEEYCRFMAISVAHQGIVTPIGDRVDDFWHVHLVFTEDYARMCQAIFGRFVHHRPGVLEDDEANQERPLDHERTLYRQVFGAPDSHFWYISEKFRGKGASNCSRPDFHT